MQLQFAHVLIEVDVGSGLHSDSLVQEVVAVEVEGDDFVFGVESFQPRGDDPLFWFLEERPLQRTSAVVLLRKELFGQLLGEGRPTAALAHVRNGPCQTDEVDAAMSREACVLGADERVDEVGRQFAVPGVGTVLSIVAADELSVGREDPCGEVCFGVGQGVGVRQFTERSQDRQAGEAQQRAQTDKPGPHLLPGK